MSALRQAVLGIMTALVSSALVFGSILLALAEGGKHVALAPAPTSTEIIATLKPGEPTFTPTLPEPTETPTESAANCKGKPSGWIPYEVLPGETLPQLAQRYGTSVDDLRRANCLFLDSLAIGSVLSVPPPPPSATPTFTPTTPPTPTATEESKPKKSAPRQQSRCDGPPASWIRYRVRKGDTLSAIARVYGTTVARLKAENCLTSNKIRGGQVIKVPNIKPRLPKPTPRSAPRRPVKTLPPPVDPGPLPVPPPVEFQSPPVQDEVPVSTRAPVVPNPSLSP